MDTKKDLQESTEQALTIPVVMSRTFTLTWKDAQEEPPEEGGRYWCLVREISDLGTSYYQWNCSYNETDKRWTSHALHKDVVFWTELAPRPI